MTNEETIEQFAAKFEEFKSLAQRLAEQYVEAFAALNPIVKARVTELQSGEAQSLLNRYRLRFMPRPHVLDGQLEDPNPKKPTTGLN
jgi:hypothetical protein